MGDGAVPVKELHAGLEKAGYRIPIGKIREVGGDDKEVDKEEFRKLEPELMKAGMKKMKKEGKEGGKGEDVMKEAEQIFHELDDDGDGAVPVKELHAGLEKAGYHIPIGKIREVGGDDKEVDKEEFRKLEPELMKAGMKMMKKEGKEGGKGEDVMKEAEQI